MKLLSTIFLVLIYSSLGFTAQEMSFRKAWTNPTGDASGGMVPLDISVYISQQSEWSESEVISRLVEANRSLNTCGYFLDLVFFFNWNFTNELLRVDDYFSDDIFYDGIRFASQKSFKVTPIQLFYFQNYLEPFTSGPAVPLAIYPKSDNYDYTFNTTWFPFKSAQRLLQKQNQEPYFNYNEEAHEIGHILLKDGHDHSGKPNIMANSSTLRDPIFLKSQCQNIEIPTSPESPQGAVSRLFPIVKLFFLNYSKDFYMSDWCSRNVSNFYKMTEKLHPKFLEKLEVVYALHKNNGESFYPLKSRRPEVAWKFHAFLYFEGWVIDLDFTNEAKIVKIKDYIDEMFGVSQAENLHFVFNSENQSIGYSYQDILSYSQQNRKKWSYRELINIHPNEDEPTQ